MRRLLPRSLLPLSLALVLPLLSPAKCQAQQPAGPDAPARAPASPLPSAPPPPPPAPEPSAQAPPASMQMASEPPRPDLARDRGEGDEPRVERRWYSSQIVIADFTAGGLLLSAPLTGVRAAYAGLGLYLLGGPTLHLAHGNPGRSVASLGLRLSPVPVTLGTLLLLSSTGKCPFGGDDAVERGSNEQGGSWAALCTAGVLGASLGSMIAAMVIDAKVLAHEDVPASRVSVTPMLRPVAGGAAFGVGGFW